MLKYTFSAPATVTIEIVAADEASARALAGQYHEAYPEIDLEEGDLNGAGRITLTCVTVTGDATLD
jgi:hypothetical protein